MKTANIIFLVVAIAILGFVVWAGGSQKPEATSEPVTATTTPAETNLSETKNTNKESMTKATITTNQGIITLELFADQSPKTVENFVTLARKGFYDSTRFHRVIKGFMIQGGDPLSKDLSMKSRWGTGGPGYTIPDEFNSGDELYKTGYKRGILAMARTQEPNSGGSQFFIMHQDYPLLPPEYTIFGKVTSGLDVVDIIATIKTEGSPTDRPLEDMIIQKITIE
ncbi:MAG: Peptidyl-prolyl cis-trans isomerase (Rotamase)-cyclophilin family [Parcubacteria group bacterium GW2011_GWA1_47_8]|nr:MAG: Peptidyl-prolyl cis-trans isomerase (Rotamase)-cyclophilin family [Parcubacteria group bacterium GW2011_GWA1_47_8]KKW07319.1 MAG: Peptidyl-prolyl cis-trans isomerase (Rotamase)-cyclophilin family [Parcubacteria group bacterium GW2011_GWA2_49_16]